jgi:hypothetical protein
MSDPKRWVETDAPPHVRAILSAARPTPPIDDGLRGRLGQYVVKAARAKTGVSLVMKGLAAVGVVSMAAILTAKVSGVRRDLPVSPAPPATIAPLAVIAPPGPVAAPPETAIEEPPAPAARPKPAVARRSVELSIEVPRVEAQPVEAQPDSELQYVERARSRLAQEPAEALRLADRRKEKFPRGTLGPEAEMIAVQALERLGRRDDARARSEAALARYPGSIYADSWRRRAGEAAKVGAGTESPR